MAGIIEVVGWVIVGGSAALMAVGLYGAIQRRVRESTTAAREARLFQQRAQLLLQSNRADRERSELSWNGNRKFYIDQKVEEAKDICSFYLKPHDHKPLAPFLPGQYLTFQLTIPDRAKPLIRCYSLSDSPAIRDHYRVTIKRMDPPPKEPDAPPGLSSNFFHKELVEGDILDVRPGGGLEDQAGEGRGLSHRGVPARSAAHRRCRCRARHQGLLPVLSPDAARA